MNSYMRLVSSKLFLAWRILKSMFNMKMRFLNLWNIRINQHYLPITTFQIYNLRKRWKRKKLGKLNVHTVKDSGFPEIGENTSILVTFRPHISLNSVQRKIYYKNWFFLNIIYIKIVESFFVIWSSTTASRDS